MKEKIIKGFLNLSFRQIAGSVISAAGSVLLARSLGLEAFGLYAISSFFVLFLGNLVNWGANVYLIKHDQLTDEHIRTAFTMVLVNGIVISALVFTVIAPLLTTWYGKEDLFLLISLSYIGIFISSIFKISQSLIEREMDYGKIGIVEVAGIVAFYLSSVTAAYMDMGILSIVIGEICRGISTMLGFIFRPFSMRPLINRKLYREMFGFGSSYITALLPWSINGALNPVVVGRLAGIEAAGIIRIAEGIVSQTSFFIGVTNRMSYPVFAKYQGEKGKVLTAVEKGRTCQFFLACLPLYVFSALSFWLVPLLYGAEWYQVTNALVIMCMTFGINTIFGLYSSSLITAGRNSDVARFTVTNGILLWLITPLTVYYFGYLGLPAACVIASPAYYIMHRYFVKNFGRPDYSGITTLLAVSYIITVIAWSIKSVYMSPVIFIVLSGISIASSKSLKYEICEILALIKLKSRGLQSI